MKPNKYCLLQKQVSFLGHVVDASGISTHPSKLESVKNWPIPKSVKDTSRFLGLYSFYRKFVHIFPDFAKPICTLTESNCQFN